MGGETVEHAGDRVVEGVVETIYWLEKCRLVAEEIARCFEEIREKADNSAPDRRGIQNVEFRI